MTKLRVGLLFGGRSVEHEVSIASAGSIFRALDPTRYEVHLVAVDQQGRWHLAPPALPPQSTIQGTEVHKREVHPARSTLSMVSSAPSIWSRWMIRGGAKRRVFLWVSLHRMPACLRASL